MTTMRTGRRQAVLQQKLLVVITIVCAAVVVVPSVVQGQEEQQQQQQQQEQRRQQQQQQYLDRFTYQDTTIDRGNGYFDYAPNEWRSIECDLETSIDNCTGYIDSWSTGREWSLDSNDCKWCPQFKDDGSVNFDCGRHHQSPIDLKREYGFEPGTHPNANECIDLHWMKYEDSFCTFDQLQTAQAFTIERHALRIAQPIETYDDVNNDLDGVPDGVRLMCRIPGRGSRFGRIDYSKGFADWWYLSHIDLKVPSEHVQEGKRYDAEFQLAHFYSIPWWNEMGTVSVFLEAYDDAPVYRELDRIICEWRKREHMIRSQCGLDPISGPSYPGCFPLNTVSDPNQFNRRTTHEEEGDGHGDDDGDTSNRRQMLRRNTTTTTTTAATTNDNTKSFRTIVDVLKYNYQHQDDPNHVDIKVHLDGPDSEPAEDKDWDAWIQEQSDRMKRDEDLYHQLKHDYYYNEKNSPTTKTNKKNNNENNDDDDDDSDEEVHKRFRKLIEGTNIPFHNYFPMIGVRTEYYYRYEGTQTIPPCHGAWISESRRNTNHWRVMKDPIRIHPRQLQELKRLLADRIAPPDDPVDPCQPSTAAKVSRDDTILNQDGLGRVVDVDTARPLQYITKSHFKTFCECKDWPSKWPEDRLWCTMENNTRFYNHPYNFDSTGW